MTAIVTTVEGLVNIALDRIGWPESIANIYEGTRQARIALRAYGEARDALLREADWGFPRRDAVLTLVKSAPAGGYNPGAPWSPFLNPPLPYRFEYAYPDDCLMVRALRSMSPYAAQFIPAFAPRPVVFEIANDPYGSGTPLLADDGKQLYADDGVTPLYVDGTQFIPGRVILCQASYAVATYCGQIQDPSQWDIGFVEAMIDELAMKLAPALAQIDQAKLAGEKIEMAAAPLAAAQALSRVG